MSTRDVYRSVKVHNGWIPPVKMGCPLCGTITRINVDGSLRRHRMPPQPVPGMSWDFPMYAGPVCKMSNH